MSTYQAKQVATNLLGHGWVLFAEYSLGVEQELRNQLFAVVWMKKVGRILFCPLLENLADAQLNGDALFVEREKRLISLAWNVEALQEFSQQHKWRCKRLVRQQERFDKVEIVCPASDLLIGQSLH